MKTIENMDGSRDRSLSARAVIITLQDLSYASRALKQADALLAIGFDVSVIGVRRHAADRQEEYCRGVRLRRVRTTHNLHAGRPLVARGPTSSRSAERAEAAKHGGLRAGFAGIRMFAGRMKDNVLLARAASDLDPTVVVASDLMAWAAGYLTKRRTHAPLVLDVRDLVLDSGARYPGAYRWFLARLERFVIHHGDALTTVSDALADVLVRRYPRAPRAQTIYSGSFERVEHAEPPQRPLRLYFQGNFASNRLLDQLVRAVAMLDADEASLVLQGFGPEESSLRALAAELGCEDRVTFAPPCDPRDVVAAASQYDVGVINYRGDTLNLEVSVPIKLIDYMAAGLAVLASDLPGIRSIVEPEECGLLFVPEGPEAIATAIRELVAAPDRVARMKANAVTASPRYLARVQGERFVAIVQSVIAAGEA